jgi:NADPH-dependent ferric siderophore reductase
MARASTRIVPERTELLTLHVLRRTRISPSFVRVTLGGDDLARFTPLGADQWFRLFLPVAGGALTRLPNKLDTLSYLRYLTISKTERPVLRNYSVSGFRTDGRTGPELDIDFVVHGSAADGSAGPAATWAQECVPGDAVAILDEGVLFVPPKGTARYALVADETALPALAGILASLAPDAAGTAVIEVPHADDVRSLAHPADMEVRWSVRAHAHADHGGAARDAVLDMVLDTPVHENAYCWVAGEQALVAAVRRHWVRNGVDKHRISFTGYWRASRSR